MSVAQPTKEERALARQYFRCRAILANGSAYQDLFWDVMKAKHGQSFATVAPQGSKGDGGNDGYHTVDRHYFQAYAPVDPLKQAKRAVRKLDGDFQNIKDTWGGPDGTGIRKFSFNFNDKYSGAPKDIELALDRLRLQHPTIEFAHYCCRDLESDFMTLGADDWDRILGGAIPAPDRIPNLEFGELRDVIRHIMAAEIEETESRYELPPELFEKIQLVRLSAMNAVLVQHGALFFGRVNKYVADNSLFALDELRSHVVGVYETAKHSVLSDLGPAHPRLVDTVFAVFRRSLCPKGGKAATMVAVDAVIGYFFEACDVFDPRALKELPGAAP